MLFTSPLGCTDCYEIFQDVILAEMLDANKISARITTSKKSIPIHIGHSPGEAKEISPSLALASFKMKL